MLQNVQTLLTDMNLPVQLVDASVKMLDTQVRRDVDRFATYAGRLKHALWIREGVTGEKLSQARLAELVEGKLGKSFRQTTAGGWLAGAMPRGDASQLALAEVLGVDPGWLYYGAKSRAPAPEIPAHLRDATEGIQQTRPHHGRALPDLAAQERAHASENRKRRRGNGG